MNSFLDIVVHLLHVYVDLIEFFPVYTKLAEMAILASKDFRKPKNVLPPVELNLMPGIITGLWVQHQATWATKA